MKKIILLGIVSFLFLSGCSSEKAVESENREPLFSSSAEDDAKESSEEEIIEDAFVAKEISLTPPDTIDTSLHSEVEEDGVIGIFDDSYLASSWLGKPRKEHETPVFKQDEVSNEMIVALKSTYETEFQVCYVDGQLLTVIYNHTLPESAKGKKSVASFYEIDLTEFNEIGEHVVQVVNFGASEDFDNPEIVYSANYIVE